MDLARFRRQPLLGIVRGISIDDVDPLTDVVIEAGLETIEITMNTSAAPELIRRMVARADGRLTIGAGTVLDVEMFGAARAAGASFIVMPCVIAPVIARCIADGIPV